MIGRAYDKLGADLICMGATLVCGRIGLIVGAIFLPLAFPLSLSDSSQAENTAVALAFLVTILFAAAGAMLCWKLTARWVRD